MFEKTLEGTAETCRRLEAALAEAGYPCTVWYDMEYGMFSGECEPDSEFLPAHVLWKAFAVIDPLDASCYTCWYMSDDKDGDLCQNIGLPPVEDCGRVR